MIELFVLVIEPEISTASIVSRLDWSDRLTFASRTSGPSSSMVLEFSSIRFCVKMSKKRGKKYEKKTKGPRNVVPRPRNW